MPPPQVSPWLVFGIVQLELPGTGIELADIWAASVASATKGPHGLNLTVLLGGVPEADQQFDIEGTGRPGAPRIVGCRHLKPPPSQCKLQPTGVPARAQGDRENPILRFLPCQHF